ncbi:hypothetical protein SLEP1_g49642 [Rubroshorea leprosula]|uniref:Uncharacterized protein n=1 Tax=Rubroshorea leprosula TaxID=152421 RepID=A0AAV5LXL2_9ROSI|nr:hypothetical protein SLEP1_g49642 [Rubroshorea leprosula]
MCSRTRKEGEIPQAFIGFSSREGCRWWLGFVRCREEEEEEQNTRAEEEERRKKCQPILIQNFPSFKSLNF